MLYLRFFCCLLLAHGRQKIEEEGMNALEFVRLAGGGCWVYGTKYAVGELLTLIASANVVFINFGLKARMRLFSGSVATQLLQEGEGRRGGAGGTLAFVANQ